MEGRRKRLGVIGHPIKHSLSPAMHRAALKEMKLPYTYDAFDVTPEALGAFIEYARDNMFLGLNVTIPHKVPVIEFLDELSNEARLIGAVNTIKFTGEKAVGYNTDGIGCIDSLRSEGIDIKGKKILLLGAGGAARAIAYQCALSGAEVFIHNRHMEKAEDLAKEIKSKIRKKTSAVDIDKESLSEADILINATSVGMQPEIDETMIPAALIPENKTVLDIVYNPIETRLLRDAKAKKCRVINGIGMLAYQGAESIRLWIGIEAPVKAMKQAALSELSKR